MDHNFTKSASVRLISNDTVYIAVCDDEQIMCDMLEEKIKAALPNAVVRKFSSGNELLNSAFHIDILFLDIQMSGIDGMETARALREQHNSTLIIFVTAIEEYVFQAFDVDALNYIVKPFSDDKFLDVLKKAVKKVEGRKLAEADEEEYIMVQMSGIHTKLSLAKIIYAEVFNRKIVVHMVDGAVEYYGKISDLEKKAGEDFFRPHRSYLIHFKYVQKYDASSVEMGIGTVPIAKPNYSDFVKKYLKYTTKKGMEIK